MKRGKRERERASKKERASLRVQVKRVVVDQRLA
jgi:hypothetical protein